MVHTDLSKIHHPISPFFADTPDGSPSISDEQKGFFDRHGYLSGIKLLSQDQIFRLNLALDELIASDGRDPRYYEFNHNESSTDDSVLFHALGAWRISADFHDLVFYAPLAAAARVLIEGPVRFWHDQIFVKPPVNGGFVAWHQDYSYWTRTKPMAHLTCWIALDDSTVENGCVHYVPGSHKWGLLPKTDLADNMESVLANLDEEQQSKFNPVAVEMKAGEASFHHAMTLHGSYENRSDQPRRGVVINMFRDGVFSDSDVPLLKGVPIVARGSKIEGQFFPLITAIL